MEKIYKEVEEAGDMHSVDCCANSEGGCDAGLEPLDCCDNMRWIKSIIRMVVESLSYDMKFDSDEQRKAAVEMYLGEAKEK